MGARRPLTPTHKSCFRGALSKRRHGRVQAVARLAGESKGPTAARAMRHMGLAQRTSVQRAREGTERARKEVGLQYASNCSCRRSLSEPMTLRLFNIRVCAPKLAANHNCSTA